jgi:hypothetical protein
MVIVGSHALSMGHLDIDWAGSRGSPEYALAQEVVYNQAELYSELVDAARLTLGASPTVSSGEILNIVGKSQSDISSLLSGAILLNDSREHVGMHPSCVVELSP